MTHLITGYAGEEHISSKDQAAFNAAFIGDGEYVMQTGNRFAATITSNNSVRIVDGDILMQGRHVRIEPNHYEDITVTTGSAGTYRNDLIVMTYEKDESTGIETAYIEILKGDEVVSNPTDPMYEHGDILNSEGRNQMPLYRVVMRGVVLSSIELLFEIVSTFSSIAEEKKQEFISACTNHLNSLNILDTKEEIELNTTTNQLAGALPLKDCFTSLGGFSFKALAEDEYNSLAVKNANTIYFILE